MFLNKFIENNNLKKNNVYIRNTSNKITYEKLEKIEQSKRGGQLNFFEKYVDPIIGIFYLWYKYLFGYKVAYINFLPLWNFLVFLFLPPKTIIGPITGTTTYDSNLNGFEKIFRKYIMPFLSISKFILSFRYTNLIFNTIKFKINFVKKIIDKSQFDFIYNLYDLEEVDINMKKK